MYLKSIEVQGFKSFANKILFEFKNGITGIVGPNGSGKSNVADAVRWVLGEQSAKQLRGNSMQDVIFSGTELRRPQGFAYVSITFDNADHKLPIEFEEVTVARRVYRSGESEYLLNGTGCRLKDMQELFLDTGIGKEGYSIIGQGQIDRIVSGKPEERRELLDEAAGIVKFKKRKALTEKNLAEEQLNLGRVQDIIAELEKQLGPLEKQSGTAREYLKLKEELRRAEVSQFLLEQGSSSVQEAELTEKQRIVDGDLTQARAAYDDTKNEYERAEQELEQFAEAIDAAKEEKARCQVEFEKTEGDIRLLHGQMDAIRQNSLHFSDTLSQVEGNLAAKQEELAGYLAKKQETDGALDALDDEQTEKACRIQEIRGEIESLDREIEESNGEIFRLLNENTNNKANLQRYETMREQSAIKRAELNKRVLEHKSLESQAQDAIRERGEQLHRASEEVQNQGRAIRALEESAEKERQEIERLGRELEEKQRSFLADSSRLDSLRNITERYEGYGNSVRRIMEQRERFPGIEGVVADLIKVDKSYETAVETALGGSIQNVVTDSEQTAKKLIEFLKKTKAGRATFLPLTSITPARNSNESALREPGVIGLASSLVRADKRYGALVQFLLGRIFVVDTIDHALALAKKYSYTLRIVTVEGEQLNPGGSISGGAYKSSGSLLSRRREMEELEQRLPEEKAAAEQLAAGREEARTRRNGLREKAEQAKEKLRELYVLQNTAKIGMEQAEAKLRALEEEFGSFSDELHAMEGQTAALMENIRNLNSEFEKNAELRAQKERRIDECTALRKEKQQEEQKQSEELSGLKSRFSALEQNSGNLLENIRRVRAELAHLEEERTRLNESAGNFESSLKEKREELERCLQSRTENEEKAKELSGRIEELSAGREEKTRLHKGFFARREELSGRIALLDREAFRLAGQLEKLAEAAEARINYLWEEYELTPSAAAEQRDERFLDQAANKKQIAALKNSIRGLGDVNVNAIEDYRQVSERYEFLTGQRDDLKNSEQALLGIIAELDEEMRRQFAEKFAEITRQFEVVFRELFGGGKASLELQEDGDILEAGIRIIAQPPGKKLQNMMQLSGGEKALTAISLLFAIQNLKPSPFCLLDEIEAALDDSNVKRFARYLHRLTRDTQFIVITHRRGTMAAADVLYGITMQEKGVSTLVSVSLIEGELDK